MASWQRGEAILLREIFRGRVWSIRPVRLVEDGPVRASVFLSAGTRWLRPVALDGAPLRLQADDWRLRETDWVGNSALRVWRPGETHSVLAWWSPDTWEFQGWYVNFEEPMRRSGAGFDYLDLALDIVVRPDRRWSWKDEDEFAGAQERGILDAATAAAIRADAASVIAAIETGAPPFDAELPQWQPDPSWAPLSLPANLRLEPGVRWDGPTQSP